MSKTIIEVKCTDQVLTFVNTPVIASGGVGEDYVSVEFCPMWMDYAKSLIFWRKGIDPIPVVEDEEGFFQVPPELTGVEGIVYFGAVGYDANGNRRTSEAVSYRLEAGAITEGTELPAPSGDVFDQLMAYYADVKLYVSTRIDDAADAALAAGKNAQAAQAAAENAEERAKEAVEAVGNVVYPGIVEGYLDDGSNTIGITLDKCPPDKMFLTFRVPYLTGTTFDYVNTTALHVVYPGIDTQTGNELFWLQNGFRQAPPVEALAPGDIITVLLARTGEAQGRGYLLNPRLTNGTVHEMNKRFYPGTPASVTTDGTMTIALDYEPEDKMVLVFTADEASSQVTKFQLEYYNAEYDLVQAEYALWDAKDSPVQSYGFYQGDYVVVVLTPADKRATVLNPRVTRDTMNLIQGVVDMIPSGESSGGCEVISYVGDGTSSLSLVFSKSPKVIQIESLGAGGYSVSAILSRDEKVAKVKVFSDGNYYENVVAFDTVWDKLVVLLFTDYGITPSQLNFNGTTYKAIGFM